MTMNAAGSNDREVLCLESAKDPAVPEQLETSPPTQKKREERMRLEATRRDALFARPHAVCTKQPPPVSWAVDSQAFTKQKAATDLTKATPLQCAGGEGEAEQQ